MMLQRDKHGDYPLLCSGSSAVCSEAGVFGSGIHVCETDSGLIHRIVILGFGGAIKLGVLRAILCVGWQQKRSGLCRLCIVLSVSCIMYVGKFPLEAGNIEGRDVASGAFTTSCGNMYRKFPLQLASEKEAIGRKKHTGSCLRRGFVVEGKLGLPGVMGMCVF